MDKEYYIYGVLLLMGTITGYLISVSGETPLPWRAAIVQGVLNGVFTMGLYAAMMFVYADMPVMVGVGIAGGLSAVGRNALLQAVARRLK